MLVAPRPAYARDASESVAMIYCIKILLLLNLPFEKQKTYYPFRVQSITIELRVTELGDYCSARHPQPPHLLLPQYKHVHFFL